MVRLHCFSFLVFIEAKFFSPYNLVLILRNSCILLIAGIGMTMAILISQIDLSVGSVLSLSGVVTAICVQKGLPVGAAILVGLLIAGMIFVLKRTKLGYMIYSIGGSEHVARTCGIKVTKFRIIVYVLSGLFAAIAGILISGMTNSASPIVGAEYSFNTMAAVIIGGTSFDGGKGGLAGTVLGTLLLRILSSGLNMAGIPAIWHIFNEREPVSSYFPAGSVYNFDESGNEPCHYYKRD